MACSTVGTNGDIGDDNQLWPRAIYRRQLGSETVAIHTMSSTLVETLPAQVNTLTLRGEDDHQEQQKAVAGHPQPGYPYARFLPSYDQNYKLPPLEPFEHVDPGHAALTDKEPRSFLKGSQVTNLTPRFGTEVSGVQLSSLGKREKR
jgi:sulfonate dioxygenase